MQSTLKPVTDRFSVAPQITVDDLRAAHADGFTHVVMNRPDGEEPGMTSRADIETEAKTLGMTFHYIPIVSGELTMDAVEGTAKLLADADGKVLAFCRSGTRSIMLWAMAGVVTGSLTPEDALTAASHAGYDLSGLAPAMQSLAGGE